MAETTNIEWTEATWNPVTGCTRVSPGCDHCYAERIAERFRGVPGHPFEGGFDLTLRPERLDQPGRWCRPRMIFVGSMSDLFHKEIPESFLDRIFDAMDRASHHAYQSNLTKRSSRLRDCLRRRYGHQARPPRLWAGVSVETEVQAIRIRHLRKAPARVRFLSIEPMLGPMDDLDLRDIDWVIVGGESGRDARPMHPDWARKVRDQCREARVPFFFKQWGGKTAKSGGRILDGREWNERPEVWTASPKALEEPPEEALKPAFSAPPSA